VTTFAPNPDLDLVLERTVAVAPELVWKAWTTPELVARWFAPRPWSVAACEIDLQPGGAFRITVDGGRRVARAVAVGLDADHGELAESL
jgi:uncharacterized protein YndB with AHSA1/START domain